MNIKINKEQADYLFEHEFKRNRTTVGSHMYGTQRSDSDKDILITYYNVLEKIELVYNSRHQFQYDDKENNIQYIFTTYRQFWQNLLSGDSTINADYIMWGNDSEDEITNEISEDEALNIVRTYNIIKAYLGFAKRDIKDLKQGKGKNKNFHIQRGLYCAECLLHNKLPQTENLQAINITSQPSVSFSIDSLERREKNLRIECNNLFNIGELTMYPKLPIEGLFLGEGVSKELIDLYINSLNIKEFHYD